MTERFNPEHSSGIPPKVEARLHDLLQNQDQHPTSMPADFYRHASMLEFEIPKLFIGGWMCVGRLDEIENPGDYFCVEMLGESLLVTRRDKNNIAVLSNVCRHRGSLLLSGRGNSKRITCPYHKWTYNLQGKLLRAPLVEDQEGFDKSRCSLPAFRSVDWMGFIFVNLDKKACDFAEAINGLDQYVENYHPEQMRTVDARSENWPVNWKCLAENFMEGYHLTPVHLKTLHPMTPTRLCQKIPAGPGYTGYKSHYDEKFPGRKPFHPDMTDEERNLSMMVWIYPGFVAAISPNSCVYMSISPVSKTKLQTRWGVIARDELFETDEAQQRYEFAKSFNAEDKARLIDVQKGLRSRFTSEGLLAPPNYEGTVWDFFHYVANKLPGREN